MSTLGDFMTLADAPDTIKGNLAYRIGTAKTFREAMQQAGIFRRTRNYDTDVIIERRDQEVVLLIPLEDAVRIGLIKEEVARKCQR